MSIPKLNIDWSKRDSLPEGNIIDLIEISVAGTRLPHEQYTLIMEGADGVKNIYTMNNAERSALVRLLIGIKMKAAPPLDFRELMTWNPCLSGAIIAGIGVAAGLVIAHICKKKNSVKKKEVD